MKGWQAALAVIALTAAFCLAGESDYQSEIQEQQRYCDMVAAGAWPAFNTDIDCNKGYTE